MPPKTVIPSATLQALASAKTTLHRIWMGWRRFLGFLAITEATALEIAPTERLTIQRVRRFVDHLGETNTPHSVASQIDALYGAARTMLPERDWSWLRTVKARLHLAAGPKGPSGPVITSVQLVDLGEQLMNESKIVPGTPVKMVDAIRYRDGLMIALLGFIAPRHKNIAAIQIGRDLVREGENWFIAIPPEDTKTKIPLDFEVPELLQPYLETYLTTLDLVCSAGQHAMPSGLVQKEGRCRIPQSGRCSRGTQPDGWEFALPLTMPVMLQQRHGQLQLPLKSASRATFLRIVICE